MKKMDEQLQIIHDAITSASDQGEPLAAILCQTCADLGVVSRDVAFGDPDFGKLFHCQECDKGQQQQLDAWEKRVTNSRLPGLLLSAHPDDLDIHDCDPKKVEFYACIHAMFRARDNDFKFSLKEVYEYHGWQLPLDRDTRAKNCLFIFGDYGMGKSYAVAALMNAILSEKMPVLYTESDVMIDHIREDVLADRDEKQGIQALYRDAPFLIIDEAHVGTKERSPDPSDFVIIEFKKIVKHRGENQKPTIIITNLLPQKWREHWGYAIVAYLSAAHILGVGGKNLRPLI